MPIVIAFIALILWTAFGSPSQTAADLFWSDEAAPWEEVDAFYYPDKSNLARFEQQNNVGSMDQCRNWVQRQAISRDDPGVLKGDYECGIGKHDYHGVPVYRTTAR